MRIQTAALFLTSPRLRGEVKTATLGVLDRHCERSEAIQLCRRKLESWIASSQVLLAMTTRCESAIPQAASPEFCSRTSRPLQSEGAGNAGRPMRPIAACAEVVVASTRVSQVTPENDRHSPRNGLRLISCSPRRPGFFATVAGGIASTDLTPASGRQDHTTSPSASVPFVIGASASTASRLASVTIANRPSVRRDGESYSLIWVSEKQKYFCKEGWTAGIKWIG
jgi:hypothetical protein